MRVDPLPAALLIASCGAAPVAPPAPAPIVSLPAPTLPAAAPAPPPRSALALEIERLRAASVTVRLPDLARRQADAGGSRRLAVLADNAAAALERAGADMWIHYLAQGAQTPPYAEEELSGEGTMGVFPEESIAPSLPALARYGGTTRLCYSDERPHFLCYIAPQPPLPDRSPGLVWEVGDDGSALFLSLDAETYLVDLGQKAPAPSLAPGPGPIAAWPAPVPNPGFSAHATTAFRRKEPATLAPLDAAFRTCAEAAVARAVKALAGGKPRDTALAAWLKQGLSEREIEPLAARRGCGPELRAWEKGVAAVIAASAAERTALFEKAKARVVAR